MTINGQTVNGDKFAYDNCHKIYIIEDQTDIEEAKEIGYDVYPIENLKEIYEHPIGRDMLDLMCKQL